MELRTRRREKRVNRKSPGQFGNRARAKARNKPRVEVDIEWKHANGD